MFKVILRKNNREKRKLKVREKVFGTSQRPRLSVFRSNKYIYAQLIDDSKGTTIVDTQKETKDLHINKTKVQAALELGILLAQKAKKLNIDKATFDRNGYKYHGRVKSIADGVREGGIKL